MSNAGSRDEGSQLPSPGSRSPFWDGFRPFLGQDSHPEAAEPTLLFELRHQGDTGWEGSESSPQAEGRTKPAVSGPPALKCRC